MHKNLAKITDQYDKELVLYPSKLKNILMLAGCIIFVVLGISLIKQDDPLKICGWLAIVFFGLGAIVFLVQLCFPSSSYLKLTRDHMETRSLFRSYIHKWEDIAQFYAGRIVLRKMLLIKFASSYKKAKTAHELIRGITGGADGALPSFYGLPAEKLAEILNKWRNNAISRSRIN